jgi:hypothetical protein
MAGELAPDPFGEKPASWWRSLLRSGGKGRAPKRYAGAVGALGPITGIALQSGDGLDKPTRLAIVAGLTFVPPVLVEYWWRGRERREEEVCSRSLRQPARSLGRPEASRRVQTKCKHAPRHSTTSANRTKVESSAIEPNRRTPRHPKTPPKRAHNPKVAGSNPAPAM